MKGGGGHTTKIKDPFGDQWEDRRTLLLYKYFSLYDS